MENSRNINLLKIVVIGGALLVLPFFGFAYDDKTTHPALTQEIVKLFNKSFPERTIDNNDSELIIQGSINEDSGIRWMRHFYDPVYNRGLTLSTQEQQLAVISASLGDQAGKSGNWPSAKTWALDTDLQSGFTNGLSAGLFQNYFSSNTDYSWDRAIYEYAWGNKNRGLLGLGHILHLLEDMSVPDHTRNDPHPPILDTGSPYEGWTTKFKRENININPNEKPIILSGLNDYFDKIANYSNNNFFSKDTMLIEEYHAPLVTTWKIEKLGDGLSYNFGYHRNGFKLLTQRTSGWRSVIEEKYIINDPDDLILSDYWTLLSKQAVLHGAGVINLFFDEVEKEKQSKTLYNKNRSWIGKQTDKIKEQSKILYEKNRSWFGKQIDKVKEGFAGLFFGTPAPEQNPETNKISEATPEKEILTEVQPLEEVKPPKISSASPLPAPKTEEASIPNQTPAILLNQPIQPKPQIIPKPPPSSNTSAGVPFGGVGGSPPQSPSQENKTQEPNPSPPPPPPDTTAPDPPLITNPATDNQIFSTTTIVFSGAAEALSKITQSFSSASTTAEIAGNWLMIINSLLQGTTTFQFFAADQAGNISTPSSRTVFVDSIAPTMSLAISECNQSLSPDGCVVAKTEINIEWSSDSTDLAYYSISCETGGSACAGFSFASTTATSTVYTLPTENSEYTFKARSIDIHVNESPFQTKTVEMTKSPIVINEIAWAGTSATKSQDEWIELYNPGSKTIDLSQMKLKSQTDSKPNINLSGLLAPKAYYLIERTDDSTISDITASTTASFGSGSGAGISNFGEVLAIEYKGITIDRTPNLGACGDWCGGDNVNYSTMERYDQFAPGENPSNWGSWYSFLGNGKNADGEPIKGTPGKRNSLNYLISKTITLNQDKTITKNNSPYIIPGTLSIQAGKTLEIQAGAVIKFMDGGPSIAVNGIIKTSGTASEPVIFTSFKDDSYGGDTNADGASTTPQAGEWGTIKMTSDGSEINHAIVRFGGFNDVGGNMWANIRVENSSATIKNSVIEKSGAYGIYLKNSPSSLIEANTIRDNNKYGDTNSTALLIEGGSSTIKSNTFTINTYALRINGAAPSTSPTITGNTFTQNTKEIIGVTTASPSFSGNTANSNGTNGITLFGVTPQNYTLSPDLPYVISSYYIVTPGITLTIASGTIIKLSAGTSIAIQGKLLVEGNAASKVIFTSIKDDSYGGDTQSDGAATSPQAGDWATIFFAASSASSTIDHALIRYGGNIGVSKGAVGFENSAHEIKNSTIEKNNFAGVWMQDSSGGTISDSIIQESQKPDPGESYGVYLQSSSVTIKNTLFKNNKTGIFGSSSIVNNGGGIIFEDNIKNTEPPGLIP